MNSEGYQRLIRCNFSETTGIPEEPTFILSDVVAEVYGFKLNRAMIWGVLVSQLIFAITIYLLINASSSSDFIIEAYQGVFGNMPRQIMAATLSVGTAFFINGILISKFKIYMYGKQFWLRTILSSMVGKTTLCLINYNILFLGIFSLAQIWNIMWTTWIVKFIFSLFMAPLAVIVANQLKRFENKDHYDYKENYYPFSIKLS